MTTKTFLLRALLQIALTVLLVLFSCMVVGALARLVWLTWGLGWLKCLLIGAGLHALVFAGNRWYVRKK